MSQLKFLNVIQIRSGVMRIFRGIKTNAIVRDSKPTTSSSSSSSSSSSPSAVPGSNTAYKPSEWDKTVLVITKRYPNKESIPPTITIEAMQSTMSRFRIRLTNYMTIMVLIGCVYIIITRKKDEKAVNNAEANHNDFRRQITAEYKASLEADALKK